MNSDERNKKIRSRWINIRVNEDEYIKIENWYKKTTCQSISEYTRDLLLRQPVIIKYRNQTADEFLSQMIGLKNELSAIGNNYNQAVHRLHILDRVAEIKSWLLIHEPTHQSFMKKTEEIQFALNEIYQLWLQK